MPLTLFAIPHPDDETLSHAAAIRHHLQVGHEVHVLALCDGAGSGAQVATSLDDAAFVAARDDELRRACRALGVAPGNLHVPPDRAAGGTLTAAHATQLVTTLVTHLTTTSPVATGGVHLKTYTDLPAPHPTTGNPRHPDHAASGAAARQLLVQGTVASWRAYVEPWLRASFLTANPGRALSAERTSGAQHDPAGLNRVLRAFDEYADVDPLPDPAAARFGIGYLSVGNVFQQLRPDPVNWYHLP